VVVKVTICSESSGTVWVGDNVPVENVWIVSVRSAVEAPGNSVESENVAMDSGRSDGVDDGYGAVVKV
jgi:hypothetical protein